ncbi:helix-turn-helix domain-containing protein [Saccharopolyspora mangrovi]|uniref:Helix-turn-helix transcriptional regulator n=1 Tax=Saccharopolyspora mangrovi TaxID=3082379 RepID=A0ABU6AIZ1_9PSEU|nr:helix-turn-helix transcriptional regulator [Saccharopolyspora sp. S2-29]MEB3371531.1 helix-turn-helix transcriptional regulator [Saccharopolyspora sp. S2-29]
MLEPDNDQHRKNLADTLKQLRKAAGLSEERLAARTAMSQPKISRIESGKTVPTVSDVERIVQALDVPAEARAELLALTRSANVEYTSLRSSARMGIWRSQSEIKALSESSSVVRQFLPAIPSGLIQTREYARAVLTPGVEGRPARDVDRAVQARLDSQDALNDESRRFLFLLTEQAVRLKRAMAGIMVGQLEHMAAVMDRPNVELAILPSAALVSASPLNVFMICDDRLVLTEIFADEVALRDYRDISYHLNLFEHFWERSVSGIEARELLGSISAEFMRGPD